ncbi:MAG: hypothetical protein ACRDV9_11210, partial [Acidimicrobiia bacterium]
MTATLVEMVLQRTAEKLPDGLVTTLAAGGHQKEEAARGILEACGTIVAERLDDQLNRSVVDLPLEFHGLEGLRRLVQEDLTT